jgi:hypothetical protein
MTEFKEKTHCPQCDAPLDKKPDMFTLTSGGSYPGMVCEPCRALFESTELAAAIMDRQSTKEDKKIVLQ